MLCLFKTFLFAKSLNLNFNTEANEVKTINIKV